MLFIWNPRGLFGSMIFFARDILYYSHCDVGGWHLSLQIPFFPPSFLIGPKTIPETVNLKKYRRFYHQKNTKSANSPSHFVSSSLSDFDLPCLEQVKDAFCLKRWGTLMIPWPQHQGFLTDPPLSNTLHSVFDDLLNPWNSNIPKISDASKWEIFLYKDVPLIIWPTQLSYVNSH